MKIFYAIFTITVIFNLCSCEKNSASEEEWGVPQVYMPQAAIFNGGQTNDYPVPLNAPFKNYSVDTVANEIKVVLGVVRSGIQSSEDFSVKIEANVEATEEKINKGSIENGVILPEEVYTLPETVSIAEGKRETNFYLTIDREILIEKYPSFNLKKMVLVVEISDPSKYELNDALKSTTIIIDAQEFMPTPPVENLISGGDMEISNADDWVVQDSYDTFKFEFGYTDDKPTDASGGNLRLFADDANNVNGTLYQAVEVEPGQKYQLSAKMKIPGGGDQFGVFLFVSEVVPRTEDYSEENNAFMGINTWWGCGTSPLDGDIRNIGCEGQGYYGNGLETNGIFTANASTMYISIQVYEYGGSFGGDVLIDDVLLVKVN